MIEPAISKRSGVEGAEVFGVSFDTVEENDAFARKFEFPYPLLCDTERAMGMAYGACDDPSDGYARRLTYVVGPDGVIEHAVDTQDPEGQAADLLLRLGG